ncbi:MAG: diaminopimelate epimerase [Acidimicrobiales bacterium]
MRLTKHHGLGNDFLVLCDPSETDPITAKLARSVCDRHRGIGADGLLRLSPGTNGAQLTMELRNADGGRAEMSGNGISCLVQAAVHAGLVNGPTVAVSTAAGLRTVTVAPGEARHSHLMTVDMGRAKIGDDEPAWLGGHVLRAARVDVGNPHLVLHVDDLDAIDLADRGAAIDARTPGGSNVETIVPGTERSELVMRVYERGVGITEACGTGACASAAAAVAWGLASPELVVRQPGGSVAVQVGDTIHMTVPVVQVASIDWFGCT